MATYKEVAEACGVSKQHIYNIVKEIDPNGEHINKSGYATELDDWLVSAVSNEAMKRKRGAVKVSAGGLEVVTEAHETVRDSMKEHYEELLKSNKEHYEELLKEKDERIADLKEQIDEMRRQLEAERTGHETTRQALAMSRELEGFHLPGYRARVMARYALPPASGQQ